MVCRRINMMYRCSMCGGCNMMYRSSMCSMRSWRSMVFRSSMRCWRNVVCRRCVRRRLRLLWCWLGGSSSRFLMWGGCCSGVRSCLVVGNGLFVMSDCCCVMSNGCLMLGSGLFLLYGGLKGFGCGHVMRSVELFEFRCVHADSSDVMGESFVNCNSRAVL